MDELDELDEIIEDEVAEKPVTAYDVRRMVLDMTPGCNVLRCQNQSLPHFLNSIINKAVVLPQPNWSKLVTAYYMMPSAFCSMWPILLIQGQSGSGKSTLGLIGCLLHDIKPFAPNDTFASIRNKINTMKFTPSGDEKHCIMVWDDIDPSILNPTNNIYSMLKVGVDRRTELLSISSTTFGQNINFKVGCGKVISTIHPLLSLSGYSELVRRTLLIRTKPSEISPEISLDDYDWRSLKPEFDSFWQDKNNIDAFLLARHQLKQLWRSPFAGMCLDLMATAVACGLFHNADESVDYFKLFQSSIIIEEPILESEIKRFVKQLESNFPKETPIAIRVKQIKDFCYQLMIEGLIDNLPKTHDIRVVMDKLGYDYGNKSWQKRF